MLATRLVLLETELPSMRVERGDMRNWRAEHPSLILDNSGVLWFKVKFDRIPYRAA
jgi:hypothetical protein